MGVRAQPLHDDVHQRAAEVLSFLMWEFALGFGSGWASATVINLVEQGALSSKVLHVFS